METNNGKPDTTPATLQTDAKSDAAAPQRKRKPMSEEQKQKISEAMKRKHAQKKGEPDTVESAGIPLKYFLLSGSKAVAVKVNNRSIEMFEGEAIAIEEGWNKTVELQFPDLLDHAPILHGILPTAAYFLRVYMSPRTPYTPEPVRDVVRTPAPAPEPERTKTVKPDNVKPVIHSVEDLRTIKLEGLDESKRV